MIEEIFLAIIQGFTEFLPMSSSGHLAIFSYLIKKQQDLFFYIVLHFASLIAILFYFRKEIIKIFTFKAKEDFLNWRLLLLGTLPAALFGLIFYKNIENSFNNLLTISIGFIFGGTLLLTTKNKEKYKEKINTKKSIWVGIFQCFALFPGVSRSGTTTSVALNKKINAEEAGKFSFLLFIPLSIGSLALEIIKMDNVYFNLNLLISFIICFAVSLFSLKIFFATIKKGWFWIFGVYCLTVGFILLTYSIL